MSPVVPFPEKELIQVDICLQILRERTQIIKHKDVYKKIVSSPRTAEHFTKELHDLFDIRMKRHSNYFESNECISSAYHFMKTVINDWFPSGQEL